MNRLVALLAAGVAATASGCLPEPIDLPGDRDDDEIVPIQDDDDDVGSGGGSSAGTGGLGPAFDQLDKARAQEKFQTTTDLMRFVISPTCAAENNECHNNEDFPDMSSEGNLWNLAGLRCNLSVGERDTIEDFCESLGDEISIEGGTYTARIGSIVTVVDADGEFVNFEVTLDQPMPESFQGYDFVVTRNGTQMPALGGGSNSVSGVSGSNVVLIDDADDIPIPDAVKQGDENRNGVFGTDTGMIVQPGDARNSYLVRRLLGEETSRVQMPLNENADNPTESNQPLSADEMYAVMSWINCMQPGESVYSPIHYDCAANADNEGTW